MNRRTFLETSAAGLACSSLAATAADIANGPTKRVALIGSGWYGKVDLLRLIQVAPVEVVALCDVDSKMLSGAAEIVAKRQKSGRRPKTYVDYRTLLKENKLELVLIGTPDHWHALPMIASVQAGCDVYVQKPTSIDVVESQAMLAAARKYDRVVQVGTQRRSTPHLMEAREQIVSKGLLGNVAHAEVCCYYHMRNRENPADSSPPETLDYDLWSGPAPRRPFSEICHPRGWRAFLEYSNGIVGDMCVHMLDTVRWMLDLGWPTSIVSQGGLLVDKDAKANNTHTQTACFDVDDLQVIWQHRA
ncbi:MAG: Gfo/Idh/MocA family oxidoreductase, partial [Verrucomicrobiota bacterium]|nr:Gfo/Idh/MocA family oxidoreductase [Verrucomicrobiota bacterium]